MIARLQQTVTGVLLLIAVGWAVVCVAAGRPLWAAGGAAIIVAAYAGFLGLEFVLRASVADTVAGTRARPRDLLRAWIAEVVTAPRVFCWQQPFRSDAEPDFIPAGAAGRSGVVLVHGLMCNRGFWNSWMRRLRARGVPFVAVSLEPVLASIDAYVDAVDAAVRRLETGTGRPPLVVGHSMGGLAARAWYALHGDPGRVRRIVTIGTPHRGTWLARFGHGSNGSEVRIGSAWLAALERRESAREPARGSAYRDFTCYYSNCDNIVFPTSRATLPGADNRPLHGAAHVELAFRPQVFAAIDEWL